MGWRVFACLQKGCEALLEGFSDVMFCDSGAIAF
jgi:hypothetical protein